MMEYQRTLSLFIDDQQYPVIINNYLEKVVSPVREDDFNSITRIINKINMRTKVITLYLNCKPLMSN